MIDVDHEINAVERQVGDRVLEAGAARSVTVSRTYGSSVDDVWDACTNPERIPRWFLPVSGDLRVGGRYELQGNASGTIERCDPPRSFSATWEYGEAMSWIELRLEPVEAGGTRFVLEHTALVEEGGHWEQYGPGAVGIGWDLGLLGLTLHLASGAQVDPAEFEAWSTSAEGRRFVARSSRTWVDADVAAGADEAHARVAGERTEAFYTGAEPAA